MYKHYGGIEKFKRSSFLMIKCLENGINKEMAIPKIISEIATKFSQGEDPMPYFDTSNKKMRSAEEILKDYGLGGMKNG